MKKPINLKTFLIPKLRRVSYQWSPRKQAKIAARVSRGKYKCAHCQNLFGPKEISMDHTIPVIDPIQGFVDWNTYIERLFCNKENYGCLCDGCHDRKTESENLVRAQVKNEKKDLTSGMIPATIKASNKRKKK